MSRMSEKELAAYTARTGKAPPLPTRPAPLPSGVVIVQATIQGEGVSVNEAYSNVPGVGRVASAALKRFKAAGKDDLRHARLHYPPREQPHRLTIVHHGNWHTLEGKPRKRDVSNYVKALEDVLCEWLGMDDRWVYEISARKVHDPDRPRMEVTLSTI